jgi:hypothetical protein
MAFSRPQFRLSTLLWITLAVACWFGGMSFERWMVERAQRKNLESLFAITGPILPPLPVEQDFGFTYIEGQIGPIPANLDAEVE